MHITIRALRGNVEMLRRTLHAAGRPDPTTKIDLTGYNARQRRRAMHKEITARGADND